MAKYKKKPVVIEVIQYNGENWCEISKFIGTNFRFNVKNNGKFCNPRILTLEGEMNISVNDYIIKGVNGELYLCKPDIFEKTYDLVGD